MFYKCIIAHDGSLTYVLIPAPLDLVRRAMWTMLYADDAGVVSRSTDELARRMIVIVGGVRSVRADVVGEEDGDPRSAREGEDAVPAIAP